MNREAEDVKTVVIYSGLGLGVAAGAYLLAKQMLQKARKNQAEKVSANEESPTTFAKQLHMAFNNDNYLGWGTNMNLVYQVFNALPSKRFYAEVQKAYSALYAKSLNADLESELDASEYNAIIRILGGKR